MTKSIPIKVVEEIIGEIVFRKVKYGFRQKSEIGTATSWYYCEAYNQALKDFRARLKAYLKK